MSTPFSLKSKTILITGASSGIGRAVAIECSKMGANIIITGRNNIQLEKTLSLLKAEGTSYIADLTNSDDIKNLTEQIPSIDGVVHAAGIVDPVIFKFISEEKLRNIFDINFFAPILLSKELIKMKKIKKGSSIIFISSISGTLCSSIGNSMYSASKSAINGMVKGMALDLSSMQIRVNTICPGMIDTGIFDNSAISKADLIEDIKKYPLKRYGKPEEVAYSAIYLLSEASSWVTGTNLIIDGGYTLL